MPCATRREPLPTIANYRILALIPLAVLTAACSSFTGAPGVFYSVQLPRAAPATVCLQFAQELSADLTLHVTSHEVSLRTEGECLAGLDNGARSPKIVVNIVLAPQEHLLGVAIQELGAVGVVTPSRTTKEMATRTLADIQRHWPEARVTAVRSTDFVFAA